MEDNSQYNELLINYLLNEVSAEQKVLVENWINGNEANKLYFEKLKNTWQLTGATKSLDYVLDEMNLDDKWVQLKKKVTSRESLSSSVFAEDWVSYLEVKESDHKPSLLKMFVVAASVLLIVSFSWNFFSNDNPTPAISDSMVKKKNSVTIQVRHEVNNTGKEKRIQLQDGSWILLAPKSEVTYNEPFFDRRDFVLIGKAHFIVAKDSLRPFTVFTGDIVTTAIGTEFTVTTYKKDNQVIVQLFKGKVVIKAVDMRNTRLKNNIYLLPGQTLVYSTSGVSHLDSLKLTTNSDPEQIIKRELNPDDPSIPEDADASYFMFNNQPLSTVFDELAALYKVPIIYNNKDFNNLFFIGRYNSTDSVELILKRIAILNNLTVTKEDTAFLIQRYKQSP